MSFLFFSVALAAAFAFISLGGGFYEVSVVDPFWPKRPDIMQPQRGDISRKRFWIAAHTAFELMLIVSLVLAWSRPEIRNYLLIVLASHAMMRIWSAFDFIPKALAFEQRDPATIGEEEARRWTRRSMGCSPLDFITCGAMLAAFAAVAR